MVRIAQDIDHDALSYRLISAPTGMTLSPQGLLTWAAPLSGSYPVTVRVDDGKAYRDQSWTLKIGATADPLEINLAIQPSLVSAGDSLTISVWGQGGALPKFELTMPQIVPQKITAYNVCNEYLRQQKSPKPLRCGALMD